MQTTRRQFTLSAAMLAVSAMLPLGASAQSVEDIKKKGKLVVGMLVDFPPFGILNTKNLPDGYDANVAQLLGKELGVPVEIVPVTGPNRIPFLLTNKVDALIASLAITPERSKQVLFSKPYSAASIVLFGDTKTKLAAPADMKGKRIGVARASTQDVAVTKAAPEGTEIRRFDDDASAMQALLSGQVDAIGCSVQVAGEIAKRAPANRFENKFQLLQQNMAVALRPGQEELATAINAAIDKNIANGELNKLYQKWIGADLPQLK